MSGKAERMMISATIRRRISTLIAMLTAAMMVVGLAACDDDPRTRLIVWSWEPSMPAVVERFEKANPDIRVELRNVSGYADLNSAIQDGYGLPDVVQIEYFALPQYAVSDQLLDVTDRVKGYDDFYTPGTWSSVQLAGRIYGLPMDSGPMAFFYNKDVFDQAGVDAAAIRSWDDYYAAARKLKDYGVYMAADAGDASFYNAMIWLAGGRPFHTTKDGKSVTIDLTGDAGTRRFTAFWQRMIDEGLVDTSSVTWSDQWKSQLAKGEVASVFAGAWMPSLLLADVPEGAGSWRVATMPTPDGSETNAENGGSAMAVLRSTRKPEAATRFMDFVCHDAQGIRERVDGGAFPADKNTLDDRDFLDKSAIYDADGYPVSYFGGQQFNKVLSDAAEDVSVGYQYLPFEVYARSDFKNGMSDAYTWSRSKLDFDAALMRDFDARLVGTTSGSNGPLEPGQRITLSDGIAAWQRDLKEYGHNQGFDMH